MKMVMIIMIIQSIHPSAPLPRGFCFWDHFGIPFGFDVFCDLRYASSALASSLAASTIVRIAATAFCLAFLLVMLPT